MPRVLHLLKGGDTAFALEVAASQRATGDEVTLALLPGAAAAPGDVETHRVPDDWSWSTLLQRIFEADQVITW
jgi:hypothetical protein